MNGNDNRAYTSWWVNGSDWSGIKDNWMLIPLSWLLNFTMQIQTQSNWCWAATSTSIAQYYDPGDHLDAVHGCERRTEPK